MLNYPQNLSYKDRLIELNLLPLEYRKEISDLIFFFNCKSKVGLVTTDLRKFCAHLSQGIEPVIMTLIIINLTYVNNQDYRL